MAPLVSFGVKKLIGFTKLTLFVCNKKGVNSVIYMTSLVVDFKNKHAVGLGLENILGNFMFLYVYVGFK